MEKQIIAEIHIPTIPRPLRAQFETHEEAFLALAAMVKEAPRGVPPGVMFIIHDDLTTIQASVETVSEGEAKQ